MSASVKRTLTESASALTSAVAADDVERIRDILAKLQDVPSPISLETLKSSAIVKALKDVSKKLSKSTTSESLSLAALSTKLTAGWKEDCASAVEKEDKESRKTSRATNKPNYTAELVHEPVAEPKAKASKTGGPGLKIVIEKELQPLPKRTLDTQELLFPDFPEFRPNLTPKEVLQAGSFGGTYYRSIYSSVTNTRYDNKQWEEFPKEWFAGLSIPKMVSCQDYNKAVNKYKIDCGGDLHMWESSGWITDADPYGWFQWYCRFYLGRRCSDDVRQIARGNGVIGKKGRWRNNLVNKILASPKKTEDALVDTNISPKVRQLLQHWGYALTLKDLQTAAKAKK